MNFKNVGTFDGGQIVSSNGTPFSGAVMDANGIASSGAFLVSELEKRDELIRKPLSSVTYPRDIVVETGGGWVDAVSAYGVEYGVTGGSGAGSVNAGGANGIPVVQASVDKGLFKAHTFANALRIMFVDMQKSDFVGRSLDQMLQDGVRASYDKHMDENVYAGFAEYGTHGIINNPDVVETSVTGGAWSGKTADAILSDINTAIAATWAAAGYDRDAIPNHILLPYEQYTYLLTAKVSNDASKSIMEYVLENNVAAKEGNGLYIGGTAWCKGAGTGGTDRMVVYVNHERFLKVDELVPLNRVMSQPNATNACYDTTYMANVSEVQMFYPNTVTYWDGI